MHAWMTRAPPPAADPSAWLLLPVAGCQPVAGRGVAGPRAPQAGAIVGARRTARACVPTRREKSFVQVISKSLPGKAQAARKPQREEPVGNGESCVRQPWHQTRTPVVHIAAAAAACPRHARHPLHRPPPPPRADLARLLGNRQKALQLFESPDFSADAFISEYFHALSEKGVDNARYDLGALLRSCADEVRAPHPASLAASQPRRAVLRLCS